MIAETIPPKQVALKYFLSLFVAIRPKVKRLFRKVRKMKTESTCKISVPLEKSEPKNQFINY